MKTHQKLKKIVKEKYGLIAQQNSVKCSCGSACCESDNYALAGNFYSSVEGYVAEADLGLGCGMPTQHAQIKKGDVVIDLGSGSGNDVFIASKIVGDNGLVIGVDMTREMIAKAAANKRKFGATNVEFRLGDIEEIPVENNVADVVLSNCVLNLVPDKEKAFSEIYRILKPEGYFCISDIVLQGECPESIKNVAEMYAGCVSGALEKEKYLSIIAKAGFSNVSIKELRQIFIPAELLKSTLSKEEIIEFEKAKVGLFSITVVGKK